MTGFEPATSDSTGRRSATELHPRSGHGGGYRRVRARSAGAVRTGCVAEIMRQMDKV